MGYQWILGMERGAMPSHLPVRLCTCVRTHRSITPPALGGATILASGGIWRAASAMLAVCTLHVCD